MTKFYNILVLVASVATAVLCSPLMRSEETAQCPPKDFDSMPNLNLSAYISHRWYSVKQVPVWYQQPNSFYCTYAEYKLEDASTRPWYCAFIPCNDDKDTESSNSDDVIRIDVFNRALIGGVNGSESTANLKAVGKTGSSKLKVGPSFLPQLFYGPYWVVDAGTYDRIGTIEDSSPSSNYDWAIISGGAPKVSSNDKCLPGKGRFNGNGLWMFSRLAIPPPGAIEEIEKVASSKGFDTTAWNLVQHEGCDYE